MPLDFRWHAFTLVAVFLALGVGIVIGVMVPQDRLVVERQRDMITRLQDDFERLRADNRRLSHENARLRMEMEDQWATMEALADQAINGRLRGQTVLLVELGEVPAATRSQITSTLEEAGARLINGSQWPLSIDEPAAQWHPAALVIIGHDSVQHMLSEGLRAAMRRLVDLGIPMVVTGMGTEIPEAAGVWTELGVKRIPDLSRAENRVALVMALMDHHSAQVSVDRATP